MGKSTTLDPDSIPVSKPVKSMKKKIVIGTWNIRRGLVKRENEIVDLLRSEDIDVLILTETDTKSFNTNAYKIQGYSTHIQLCENDEDLVRIIALTKENCGVDFNLRQDLMSRAFPSVWIEVIDKYRSKSIIGGFYRQWSLEGKLSIPEQVGQMEEFVTQINQAATPNASLIVMGDANLCASKWLSENYERKSVARPLLDCLEQNGLDIQDIGMTYQADHATQAGILPCSALDHVYTSKVIVDLVKTRKIQNSATDHLPVLVDYNLDFKKRKFQHTVTKRSFKNFTKELWNDCLSQQDWLDVSECEDVNGMVEVFNENIKKALDLAAPVKTFKIRSNHRFGLSDSTKELMKKRDRTRNSINKATKNGKNVLLNQYKILRNKVTSQIRKENIDFNNNRIEEAKNERELWNITNEVLNPRKETDWNVINKDGKNVTEEEDVAEAFNDFFIEKVVQLKENIDKKLVEDPLIRIKEKMKNNKSTLEFKEITEKQLGIHMKKLNKKKSSGLDGLSQEHLILGARNLISPLTAIVNKSIQQGEFPDGWKEAAVTPVLKKGNANQLNNYRPVSCLPAASKILEIVICSQLSDYLESNKLLPSNQHGFRPRRSTMTAWQEIQLDWALNTEKNLVTGVLLWDLSAAFDTLDCDGLCSKLAVFGVQQNSVKWIRSFLTGRRQRVRIGGKLSKARHVANGVPQGGVLSPLIFVLYVSDLQDWLLHSTAPTYADDTMSGTSNKKLDKVIRNLEEDANLVLKYMASNGLVANAKKTAFLVLNGKHTDPDLSIMIGGERVKKESSACLLGIKFDDNQQWNSQVHGKGGLLSALNSRLYIIRRLKSHLNMKSVLKVVDGIFTSKLRYGLQLLGKVRTLESDPEGADFKAIQLLQNNLMRCLNGTKVKDMVSTNSLLKKFNMLSVNQLNAKVKLVEIWKALNVEDYPLKVKRQSSNNQKVNTRADINQRPVEIGKSLLAQKTCVSDAIHLWNRAPEAIMNSSSLFQVKQEIKKFVLLLPI